MPELLARRSQARVLPLTGYASIATAVAAIAAAPTTTWAERPTPRRCCARLGWSMPMPARKRRRPSGRRLGNRVAWEHIQRVLQEQGGNVAATARALGMHRRTLQRILRKHAPTA
ncbi:MAG: hypothetical protein IPH76_18945 [Xanthomonadales bacterium]|nr:hypothetical protein [Xanthomonadales bacterium]